MTAVDKIERVLATDLLLDDLTVIPTRGARQSEISTEQRGLGRSLTAAHRALLERWNGISLEVIRFFGCGDDTGEVGRLLDFQIDDAVIGLPASVVIGSDASGFVYLETGEGEIYSLDTDGAVLKKLADNLDEFVDDVIFGSGAGGFAGQDWLEEVRENGLV